MISRLGPLMVLAPLLCSSPLPASSPAPDAPAARDHFSPSPTPAPPQTAPSILPVPDTRQSTSYSCGASALQAVLMYYGQEYGEVELMEKLNTDPDKGTNPKDIVRVARDLGFQAELKENLSLADLEASVKKGVPVIIAAQAYKDTDLQVPWKDRWDDGHYMVVVGLDQQNVYFEDPSMLGSKGFIPRQEFMERWHDVDDKRYLQSGIFISGPKPAPPPAFLYVE